MAAFARAFADGADGIELDVRLARDGVPVIIHDATLRRTGSTRGKIADMTSAQLATIDVGSCFNRKRARLAREEYAHERVPTLQQALELCRDRRGVVYIELKSEVNAAKIDLVRSVAALIKSFAFYDRATVVSFDLDSLAAIKKLDASIRTGALFALTRNEKQWRSEAIISSAINCGANEVLLQRLLVRRKLIEKAVECNLPVVVWTVDDPEWLSRAEALGIRALITNDPAKLLTQRQHNAVVKTQGRTPTR